MKAVLLGVQIVPFDKGTPEEKSMMHLFFWDKQKEETFDYWADPKHLDRAGFNSDMVADLSDLPEVELTTGGTIGRKVRITEMVAA